MFWKLFEFSISEEVAIDAPGETVWAIVSDLDNYARYLSLVESTERCQGWEDGPIQVGTKLVRNFNIGGKALHSKVTVTALDENKSFPRSIAIFADNFTERLTGRVCWSVFAEPDANSCRLLVTSTILPKRLWLNVGGRLGTLVCCFRSLSTMILRNDLHEFAHLAESKEGEKAYSE